MERGKQRSRKNRLLQTLRRKETKQTKERKRKKVKERRKECMRKRPVGEIN